MKRHGNLFEKIVDIENIRKAFVKARHAKGWMKSVKEFESDLDNNLLKIQKMLVNKTFTTSNYKNKFLYEPKLREIFVVPFDPGREHDQEERKLANKFSVKHDRLFELYPREALKVLNPLTWSIDNQLDLYLPAIAVILVAVIGWLC